MYPITVNAENRKKIESNNILNQESHDIFEDLQKRCDGKALHYIAHKNEPLIAYEVYEGFTLVLKANQDSPTFYVKVTHSFGDIRDLGIFTSNKIKITKPEDAHSALKSIKGIKQAEDILVISDVEFTQYKKLIEYASTASKKKELSPEDLLKKLERHSEIGKKGELFAIEYEKKRLKDSYHSITEAELEQAIKHIAITDVATGYDIESHYNGESRYIEVKTTISKAESDFFFSLNEYEVLKAKGEEAYIYRIVFEEKVSNPEVIELNDPFGERHPKKLKPVAFQANLNDFEI